MENILIPIAGMGVPIIIVAIVFTYVYLQRRMQHQERIAMIEKGILPENVKELTDFPVIVPRSRLLSGGITTAAIGLALLLGLSTIGFGPWLLGGLIPLAVGLGNIITYMVTSGGQKSSEKSQ